jgi:hypothetical protein
MLNHVKPTQLRYVLVDSVVSDNPQLGFLISLPWEIDDCDDREHIMFLSRKVFFDFAIETCLCANAKVRCCRDNAWITEKVLRTICWDEACDSTCICHDAVIREYNP